MSASGESSTVTSRAALAHRLQGVSAIDAADLLLASIVSATNASLTLEPSGAGFHVLRVGPAFSAPPCVSMDSSLGHAVAARLCLIAGMQVGTAEAQLGMTRVKIGPSVNSSRPPTSVVEVLVACGSAPDGLRVELHRIGDRELAGRRAEDDRYRLGRELGRGGMGVVYEAEHKALRKTVALKVLRPALSRDPRLAAQFLIEARAACRISHPGVVEVTDFGYLSDGGAFFAMELVDWPTLDLVLARERVFEPRRALLVAERIAGVLEAASAEGVVHRDLKPANIFLGPRDRVKLGDFGLAWILDREYATFRASQSGMTWGTPAYMAPEQACGATTDVRSDIYSLGLVLQRMVLGFLPERFQADTPSSAAAQSRQAFDGQMPDAVARVIRRATAEQPVERYRNATEMRADLHAAGRTIARGH